MEKMLVENKRHRTNYENNTFAQCNTILQDEGLIAIGLAGFKSTFHPDPIEKSRPIVSILKDIFTQMNISETKWQKIRDQVCDTLSVVNECAVESIKSSSSTREGFFESIVEDYTRENTYLYDHANSTPREQTEHNYIPSAEALASTPYIIVYQMILLYWPALEPEEAVTYRRVRFSKEHLEKYQPGVKFTWLGFVSSSVELEKAIPFPTCSAEGDNIAIFTINNSMKSLWQPRNVEQYARYQERERVYPAGARFQVMGKKQKNGTTYIDLKLLA